MRALYTPRAARIKASWRGGETPDGRHGERQWPGPARALSHSDELHVTGRAIRDVNVSIITIRRHREFLRPRSIIPEFNCRTGDNTQS